MTLSDDEIRQILQDKTEVKELNTSSPYLIVFKSPSGTPDDAYAIQPLVDDLQKLLPKARIMYIYGDTDVVIYPIDGPESHLGQCQYCHEVHDLRLVCVDQIKVREHKALEEFVSGVEKGLQKTRN